MTAGRWLDRLGVLLTLVGVVLWGVSLPGAYERVTSAPHGRDYASYHFAAQAALVGADPYDATALSARGRADPDRRGAVHPFFYPPPFLWVAAPFAAAPLPAGYRAWFVLDALCALVAFGALAWWWRALHPLVPALVALLLGLSTAVPNNHVMGQGNHLALALTVLGLACAGRWARPRLGGVLVGLACMFKMSPALFVLYWAWTGRREAAAWAVIAAVVASLGALPLVDVATQVRFYTQVLPGFASGDYNGLAIPVGLFGNHSLPNLFDQLWPGDGRTLSGSAATASRAAALALVLWLGLGARRPTDALGEAGRIGAVGVVMLAIPVYTYEHHLVWALPAAVAVSVGLLRGRLPVWLAPLVLVAVGLWAWELQHLKRLARVGGVLGWSVQEAKPAALCLLGVSSWWLGARAPSEPPADGASAQGRAL